MNTAVYDDSGQREPSRITNKTPDNSEGGRNKEKNMNKEIKGMVYEVGSLLPEIANGEHIGMGGKLEMDECGALTLYCQMHDPSPADVVDFKTLRAIGLYQTPEFKHGLCLWQFNNNLIVETSFNPSLYPDNRVERMGEANLMHRYLIDADGILRSLNVFGLYHDFLQKVKSIWTDPTLDWGDYSERLAWLYSNFNTDELWNRVSNKWINKN